MAKPRSRILDYLSYVALRVAAAVLRMLPWRTRYRVAAWGGELLYRGFKRYRPRAVGHLRRSFPDWSPRRVELVARASLRDMAFFAMEFILTPDTIMLGTWTRYLRLVGLDEMLRALIDRETGVIFVAGHFGNFEVLGYSLGVLGFPNTAVYRPMDNPYINAYVVRQRRRGGLHLLAKKGASQEIDAILDAHGSVSFIADQDAGRKGLFVNFFGRPASTFKAIGLMAMRHRAPIVVSYARRLTRGFRFEIGVARVIHPHEWAEQPDPLRWITQTYTKALEDVIRRDPTQYFWVHRRWKHRPKGEVAPPDGIA